MCYQGTFCIITAALISGAIVERMRFSAYVTFISLWAIVVYGPIAHWVWGGGWLAKMGALDFAGGTVVHVNAGVAALVAAIVVGKRRDYPVIVAAAAQRAVHAARRRAAVVRLVRVQRRQRAGGQRDRGAGLHGHDARAGRHARRLDAARPRAVSASRPPSAAPRRSSSAWSRSPRPPVRRTDERHRARGAGRRSRATSRWCCAPRRRSTIRSTSSPRMAWAAPSARC